MKKKIDYEVGSGNVFRDIGLRNPEQRLIKAQLMLKIDRLMKERGIKQSDAAKLFGVKQPDVSKMLRGDFRQFSVERLMRFLVALGQDVEIVVKPHRRGRREAAQLRVGRINIFSCRRGRERARIRSSLSLIRMVGSKRIEELASPAGSLPD